MYGYSVALCKFRVTNNQENIMSTLVQIITILGSSVFLYFLSTLFGLLKKLCLNPIRVQYLMKSQGINGPSYEFLHGNTKDIIGMRRVSIEKPMEGISHNIFPRISPHVHSWANLYGANFLIWYGVQAQLVVTEPELVKEILTNKNDSYIKIDLDEYTKKLLGDGLSSSKGEKWAKMRKLANHVFHSESLKDMIPAMIQSVETMLEKWKEDEGKEIEVFEEFRILASEIISRTAFGSSYLEGKNVFDMLINLTSIVSRNAYKIKLPHLSRFLKSNDDHESGKIEKGIQDCIMKIISKRSEQRNGSKESSRPDFLGKLLEMYEDPDKNKRISVEDIVDECKTFYFAGHETTTSLLTWTILLLAVDEEWQEKARKEVVELFGEQNPTADSIARLKIMNMIIEETLRLYPPVTAIKRKVEKETKLGKLTLPPQIELYISVYALQHNSKIWGEDVHLFKPERFAQGIVRATNNNAVAFLPFGFGQRTCVGLNFAIVEAKIALSMILQRYRFVLSPGYVHSPVQIYMVRPQLGVQVILHRI